MYGHGDNWRELGREGRRTAQRYQPTQQAPAPVPKFNLGRHGVSGKKAPYMEFLHRRGYKQFYEEFSRSYDQKNNQDKQVMTEYYNEFRSNFPEEFAKIEAEVKAYNSNKEVVANSRREQNKRNREMRHQNPELHRQLQKAHREAIRTPYSEMVAPPIKVPEPHLVEDLEYHLQKNRNKVEANLKSNLSIRNVERNQLFRDDYIIQLISVFPLCYNYKSKIQKLATYPAEIAITTFNFKTGVLSSDSKLVSFHSDWFYGSEGDNDAETASRRVYGDRLGISEHGPSDGCDPRDVFSWIMNLLDKNGSKRLVCDANQYNFVYHGINELATFCGNKAKNYFVNFIAHQLTSIQDYASVLLENAPLDIPRSTRWKDEDINAQFLYHYLVPLLDKDPFCKFHSRRSAGNSKYFCVKAQNARLLHSFFRILRENRLQHFEGDQPRFHLCTVDETDESLPPILSAPRITRAQEEEYRRLADDYFSDSDSDQSDDEMESTIVQSVEDENFVSSSTFNQTYPGFTPNEDDYQEEQDQVQDWEEESIGYSQPGPSHLNYGNHQGYERNDNYYGSEYQNERNNYGNDEYRNNNYNNQYQNERETPILSYPERSEEPVESIPRKDRLSENQVTVVPEKGDCIVPFLEYVFSREDSEYYMRKASRFGDDRWQPLDLGL